VGSVGDANDPLAPRGGAFAEVARGVADLGGFDGRRADFGHDMLGKVRERPTTGYFVAGGGGVDLFAPPEPGEDGFRGFAIKAGVDSDLDASRP